MKTIISLACATGLVLFSFVAEEQKQNSSVELKKADTLVFKKLKTPDTKLISELNTLKTNTTVLKKEVNAFIKIKEVKTDSTFSDSLSTQKKKKFISRLIDKLK